MLRLFLYQIIQFMSNVSCYLTEFPNLPCNPFHEATLETGMFEMTGIIMRPYTIFMVYLDHWFGDVARMGFY